MPSLGVLTARVSAAAGSQERRFSGRQRVGCEGALAGGCSATAQASCESLRRLLAIFRATALATQRCVPLPFSGISLPLRAPRPAMVPADGGGCASAAAAPADLPLLLLGSGRCRACALAPFKSPFRAG